MSNEQWPLTERRSRSFGVEHLLASAQRDPPDLDGALGDDEEAVTRVAVRWASLVGILGLFLRLEIGPWRERTPADARPMAASAHTNLPMVSILHPF